MPQTNFTVVDLFTASSASASGINRDGCVCGTAAGGEAFLFVPTGPNLASGTTLRLAPGVAAVARGLNSLPGNRADVVGSSSVTPGFETALAWFDVAAGFVPLPTTLLPIPRFPPGPAAANAVNDLRQIVGWATDAAGVRVAVTWNFNALGASPRVLAPLSPGLASEAKAINNSNVIAGKAETRDSAGNTVFHAVVWDGNTGNLAADLGTLAGAMPIIDIGLNASGESINDGNTVVGVADAGTQPVRPCAAFIFPPGGRMTLMTPLPSPNSGAWHIAPGGAVALTIAVAAPPGTEHGAIFRSNALTDISSGLSGGWLLTAARGVNDAGRICGIGSNSVTGAFNHALLLVPS
jgi:hypothetical protein